MVRKLLLFSIGIFLFLIPIIFFWFSRIDDVCPAFSRDGKKIYIVKKHQYLGFSSVYEVDLATKKFKRLITKYGGIWSIVMGEEGQFFLVNTIKKNSNVYEYFLATKTLRLLFELEMQSCDLIGFIEQEKRLFFDTKKWFDTGTVFVGWTYRDPEISYVNLLTGEKKTTTDRFLSNIWGKRVGRDKFILKKEFFIGSEFRSEFVFMEDGFNETLPFSPDKMNDFDSWDIDSEREGIIYFQDKQFWIYEIYKKHSQKLFSYHHDLSFFSKVPGTDLLLVKHIDEPNMLRGISYSGKEKFILQL